MTERMHPKDLRTLVASIMAIHPDIRVSSTVAAADALIAELERTAKPESREPQPGDVDKVMLVNHLEAMTTRAKKAEAGWEAASKTIIEMEKRNGELWSANVDLNSRVRHLEELIEAAKEMLEPKP